MSNSFLEKHVASNFGSVVVGITIALLKAPDPSQFSIIDVN